MEAASQTLTLSEDEIEAWDTKARWLTDERREV